MEAAAQGGGRNATEARRAPLIRDAATEDAPAVARVHIASWRVAYRDHLPAELLAGLSVERRIDVWRGLIGRPESPTLLAEVDGEIVGVVGVGPSRAGPGVGGRHAIY